MRALAIIGLCLAGACAHAPDYSAGQIGAIMRPLAYEQEIDRKCEEETSAADADKFLASLNGSAAVEAGEILESVTQEVTEGEAEYVCTVELYFSTRKRADDARAIWKTLKGKW